MKDEIMELILESCECGDISLEDASAYMDFLECVDLTDMDDVKVLTEMVDTLVDDYDMYYEATDKRKLSQREIERKKAEKKAKRNKVLKTVGKVAGAGAALAGVGYGAYKLGGNASDKRNASAIDKLEKKLQVTKDAFRSANAAKRGSASTIDELRDKSNKLEKKLQVTKDAFRSANEEKRLGNTLDIINTKRNAELRNKLYDMEHAFKKANAAKRDLKGDNKELNTRLKEMRDLSDKNEEKASDRLHELRVLRRQLSGYREKEAFDKRADAYKKALTGSGLADSMNNRAHVNLDDVRKHKIKLNNLAQNMMKNGIK